jgi:RimJ/RimL family protein N-acetyltransferase
MMAETPRALAIEGRLMGLRPVWPEDFPRLFDWFSDRDEAPLWTSQFRQITTFQEFMPQIEAWLRNSISLLKVDLDSGVIFGFARAYNLNLADGYAWVQAYTIPGYRMRRHGAESAILFARYLFEHFPIRKLCSEVFAFNETAVRLNEKIGFRFEGRLSDHTWYRDRYWDHLFYSLNREDWGEVLRRYAFIAGVEDELGRRVQQIQ